MLVLSNFRQAAKTNVNCMYVSEFLWQSPPWEPFSAAYNNAFMNGWRVFSIYFTYFLMLIISAIYLIVINLCEHALIETKQY